MALSLLSVALLATTALAAPRPEIEVVQIREIAARQLPTELSDLSDLLPTSLDLGDLSSLASEAATLLPTDTSLDLSGFGTLIPSGCMPPSDLIPPTPPADLESALATYTDYCHEPSLTGSASSEYASYSSALSSWAKENESKVTSWLSAFETACPYASAVPTGTEALSSLLGSVPTCLASGLGASGSGATGAQASATGASGSQGAAAPQKTAFAAAAGLVAGFAGLVAVL